MALPRETPFIVHFAPAYIPHLPSFAYHSEAAVYCFPTLQVAGEEISFRLRFQEWLRFVCFVKIEHVFKPVTAIMSPIRTVFH